MTTASQYWADKQPTTYEQGFDPAGKNWPFGKGLPRYLAAECDGETVIDFGCGTGRFAPAFHPAFYVGLDFNEKVLAIARKTNPSYLFQHTNSYANVSSETVMAVEVLVHSDDAAISGVVSHLADLADERILVLEVMDPQYRNELFHTYNRTVERYGEIAAENHLTQKVLDSFPVRETEMFGVLIEWRHV